MMRYFNYVPAAGLWFATSWIVVAAMPAVKAEETKRLVLSVLGPAKEPAAQAAIYVSHEGLPQDAELRTDSEGIANIGYPATVTRLQVTVEGDAATVPTRLSWGSENRPKNIPARYELTLEKGTEVKGKVMDDSGVPIAGATVVLSASAAYPERPECSTGISYKKLKTKADGTWSYQRLPAAPTHLSLGVYDHRYASTFGNDFGAYPMRAQANLAALQEQAGKLTLKRGPVIEGVVTGKDGKPLAGASVGIGRDRNASNILPSVKTDAEGRFSLATHPEEEVTVTVKAKDHAPELVRVQMPAEGKQALKMELPPAQTLTGRVVDFTGRPVANAFVWIDTWRKVRTIQTDLITDEEGRFVWNEAPADPVEADSVAEGFARTRDVPLKAGEANEIKLLKEAVIRLEVSDADSGRPMPKFQVTPGIVSKPDQPVSWQQESNQIKWQGKDGRFETTYSFPYPGHVLRIEADGYLPKQTPVFTIAEGDRTFTVKLETGDPLTGRVLGLDAQPVADAEVILVTPARRVEFENGELDSYDRRQAAIRKTSADGGFTFPPTSERGILCVSTAEGYAELEVPAPGPEALAKRACDLRLQPWGRIEGVVMIGTRPAAHAVVQGYSPRHHKRDQPELNHDFHAEADEKGRFVIERARPGPFSIGRRQATGERRWSSVNKETVVVKPGETLQVQIGGKGRPVAGRLDLPKELLPGGEPWDVWDARIALVVNAASLPKVPVPDELRADPAKVRAWYDDWTANTDAGRTYAAKVKALQDSQRSVQVQVDRANASFRADDIPPGEYTFSASFTTPSKSPGVGRRIATGGVRFTMPEVPGGVSDEALELPVVPVTFIRNIKVGDAAPLWEAKTLDGKPLKLTDFRGRYVLLDFWATWCGPCVAETPNLKRVYESFGADKRFAMVALSLDADAKEPKAYAEENHLPWVQGHLGDWSTTGVPASYGVEGIPSIWLIGPDGKVVAKGLRGGDIEEAVRKALR
jgi:thiol-disulfide isomerase/thioredoxin/protocatechuate 3,4-dioxygenase beta subunit